MIGFVPVPELSGFVKQYNVQEKRLIGNATWRYKMTLKEIAALAVSLAAARLCASNKYVFDDGIADIVTALNFTEDFGEEFTDKFLEEVGCA
jgi:hypothetical protein